MALVEIDDLADYGAIRDVAPYQLPPEAWSLADNMRVSKDGMARLKGTTQVFGTLTVTPHFIMHVNKSGVNYWLWASLTAIAVFDGNSERDISGSSGPYHAEASGDWNGTIFQGIPVFNSGRDVPQYWGAVTTGTLMQDVPAWPLGLRARIIRSFGVYLVAFNLLENFTSLPHSIQWSHPAEEGSMPSTWVINDPTKESRRTSIPDTESNEILDALQMADQMFIYKDGSVWKMRNIGGRFIMELSLHYASIGILASRCVAATADGKRHMFATPDDIMVHSGGDPMSLLFERQKSNVFDNIDKQNYVNSFMFTNPRYDEIWFCYPTTGNVNPNRAIIWNYKKGDRGSITEADIDFVNAAVGNVEVPDPRHWSDMGAITWATETASWSTPDRRRVLICNPTTGKILELDEGLTRDGAAFNATLRREGLALLGRNRKGEWIEDHNVRKLTRSVWPKIAGGPVNVRVGHANTVGGTTTWANAVSFNPATDVKVDKYVSGRALAVEYATSASVDWRIDGYKYDVQPLGQF